MPPLRRYLRITPRSVLETRIYLDNPTDLQRWLLNSTSPALPHVIAAVRPLVLPKLREENDIARGKAGKGKGKKKGGVKDTVVTEDFEVAIFLTQTSARHSILRKSKQIKSERKLLGSTPRLTNLGNRADEPLDVDTDTPILLREGSSDEDIRVGDIPLIVDSETPPTLKKEETITIPDDEEGGEDADPTRERGDDDEKKKMGFRTEYEGFAIYGRILCLVVKRKTVKGREMPGGAGQAMMEEWIGTQVQREEDGVVNEG